MVDALTGLPTRHVLHNLLFPGQIGLLTAVRVSVCLCLEEGDEVNARPGMFASEFPARVGTVAVVIERMEKREREEEMENITMFVSKG